MKKRGEAEISTTWRLEDMVPDNETWEKQLKEASDQLETYGEFKGKLAEKAENLYQCLKFDDEFSLKAERLYVYARMRSDEDTANDLYQDMFSRAQLLNIRASENSSYMVPEILAIPEETLEKYRSTHSGLKHFGRLLDQLLERKSHTLSKEMEQLLAQSYEATQGGSQVFTMFNNADVRFPAVHDAEGKEIPLTHGNYITLLEDQNREIRKEAFENLYSVYKQFSNTLSAAFATNVKQAVFYAKARNYASSRQASLFGNEVPETVYDNLVASVRKNLPLLHRYASLRKKIMGLDELHMYDLYVPVVAEADRHYTFEEAKNIVRTGLAPMGEEYLGLLQEGFENRWIDVYENEGKRSGAYSWGVYGCHPYVLLNFHGTLNDVFTLAHEMGHSIHTWYSNKNQSYTYSGYKIFVAEVASTCNEALLIRHLLKNSKDKQEKAYLLNYFLESFRGTLFRQTMFAEFEDMAHKKAARGESLTAESLCSIYRQLNADYFGPAMTVDRQIDYEWERIPHFYTPFYVYQYATGFSAAVAISSRIMSGEPGALEGYKKFLSGGCSMKPIDLLKLCGVDMSTTRPVDEALGFFGELIEEFKKCIHTNE